MKELVTGTPVWHLVSPLETVALPQLFDHLEVAYGCEVRFAIRIPPYVTGEEQQ